MTNVSSRAAVIKISAKAGVTCANADRSFITITSLSPKRTPTCNSCRSWTALSWCVLLAKETAFNGKEQANSFRAVLTGRLEDTLGHQLTGYASGNSHRRPKISSRGRYSRTLEFQPGKIGRHFSSSH